MKEPDKGHKQPAGLVALRPRIRYTGGLEFVGGVGFLASSSNGLVVAVTAAHLVASRAEWREGKAVVESVEFLDATTRHTVATAAAMSYYGSRKSGIQLAENFTVFVIGQPPPGATVLDVANRPAEVREEVTLYVCGQDGGESQIAISGAVVFANADRIEVELSSDGNLRAIAGAPIVAGSDGKVVGVAQSAATRDGKPVVLASPATQVRIALDSMPDRPAKVQGWSAPPRPSHE
jgi:hypothetical protein